MAGNKKYFGMEEINNIKLGSSKPKKALSVPAPKIKTDLPKMQTRRQLRLPKGL